MFIFCIIIVYAWLLDVKLRQLKLMQQYYFTIKNYGLMYFFIIE